MCNICVHIHKFYISIVAAQYIKITLFKYFSTYKLIGIRFYTIRPLFNIIRMYMYKNQIYCCRYIQYILCMTINISQKDGLFLENEYDMMNQTSPRINIYTQYHHIFLHLNLKITNCIMIFDIKKFICITK
jgi:hypothetical protein